MDTAIEIARGLGSLALKIFLIVMPLLIFLEWARTRRWFDRFIQSSNHLFAPVGFRPPALFPLMTGILFGISYGAGVLIPQSQSGHISRRQVFLIALFLCLCHAIVEDTLLFVVVGANPWVLVITRFVAAMLIVYIFSRLAWPIPPAPEEIATEHV